MDPHQRALVDASPRHGVLATPRPDITTHPFSREPLDPVLYTRGARQALVFHGRIFEALTAQADALCANKARAKRHLESLGLPTPADLLIPRETSHDALCDLLDKQLAPSTTYVVKPLDGTNGERVFMDLSSRDAILAAATKILPDEDVLIEQQAPGHDLRVQIIGGQLAAACIREPASLVGDGESTIARLAEEKNRYVQSLNPQNSLVLDAESLRLLDALSLTPKSVLERGREIRVKRVANIGQGGLPVDVTDTIHPDYTSWCERIATSLDLSILALDLITRDWTRAPDAADTVILEINAQPQWLHHTFSARRAHDIPGMLFDALLGPCEEPPLHQE